MARLVDGSKVLRIVVSELGGGTLLVDKTLQTLPQSETPAKFASIPKIFAAFGSATSPKNPVPVDKIHIDKDGQSLWIHLMCSEGRGAAVLTTGGDTKAPQQLCSKLLKKMPQMLKDRLRLLGQSNV
eukprot:gnl/Chilomastix_caulleri/921.p1 GENE.gnl/Chilomastix_caulleri/921~~gnl/Chilomastix_caulleri/921.p1  ORF type:complete len:127 (+),score=20.20 gnl/Chilomastix_caulleri/921:76-456(+)